MFAAIDEIQVRAQEGKIEILRGGVTVRDLDIDIPASYWITSTIDMLSA